MKNINAPKIQSFSQEINGQIMNTKGIGNNSSKDKFSTKKQKIIQTEHQNKSQERRALSKRLFVPFKFFKTWGTNKLVKNKEKILESKRVNSPKNSHHQQSAISN